MLNVSVTIPKTAAVRRAIREQVFERLAARGIDHQWLCENCFVCGKRLPKRRRTFCPDACHAMIERLVEQTARKQFVGAHTCSKCGRTLPLGEHVAGPRRCDACRARQIEYSRRYRETPMGRLAEAKRSNALKMERKRRRKNALAIGFEAIKRGVGIDHVHILDA
jgi:hypothetical protein